MKIFIQKGGDEKMEFTPFFRRLFLPIDQWVLTELMDDWRLECQEKVSRETFIQFKDLSKDYLAEIKDNHSYDSTWVESVIYVSLHLMSRSFPRGEGIAWIRDFSNNLTTGVDANRFVVTKIKELYEKWTDIGYYKDEKRAQPFAFYLLISAIENDTNIIGAIKMSGQDLECIDDYLNCRVNGETNFRNRLTLFAISFYQNGNRIIADNDENKLDTTGHFELVNISKVKIDRIINDKQKINVLAMGIPGSGKSTIVKMVRHVLAAPKENRINTSMFSLPVTQLAVVDDEDNGAGENKNFFGPLFNRADPTSSDIKEFTGEIKIGDYQYPMSFYDTRGGIMVETPLKYKRDIATEDIKRILERSLTDTDLLMVILDPETIFYKDDRSIAFENILEFIATRLDYLFHNSKHAMIALVFAKFDEYGTVIKGPRNLIHNDSQINCLKNFIENNTEDNWNTLVGEIGKSYLSYGEDNGLQKTIIQLLERIKFLLTVICSNKKHPVINCYIASSAIMKDIGNSLWTGYPEIFGDFSRYMDWLIKKKVSQKFDSPTSLSGRINGDSKVELKWLNQNKRDLFSIVCKKNGGDDKPEPVGKAILVKPNAEGHYVDNNVEYDTTYSYQVLFVDNLDDMSNQKESAIVTINVPPKPAVLILPPTNFQHRYAGKEGKVILSWGNENTTDVISRLERKENDGEFKLVYERSLEGSSETYNDSNLDFGKTYSYRILFAESENPSNTSKSVEVKNIRTLPNGVKQVKCEVKPNADQADYIEISWQETINSYETEYQISRHATTSDGTSPLEVIVDRYKNSTYRDNNIIKGGIYQYGIITKDAQTKLESQSVPSERILIKSKDWWPVIILVILIIALVAILYYVFAG